VRGAVRTNRPSTDGGDDNADQEGRHSQHHRAFPEAGSTHLRAVAGHAHGQYDSEERAHRAAYSAVKHLAEKRGDHWEFKDGKGASDPQAAKGNPESRERPSRTYGGIDARKPKKELYEDAKRAGIEGRSNMTKQQLARALQKQSARETARARS
jgi:hypothetical protein